jgi:hypothetical protein
MLCNLAYAQLTAGMNYQQRNDFDSDLTAPPEGWDAVAQRRMEQYLAQTEAEG